MVYKGGEMWYPLWDDSHVSATANELAVIISQQAKLASFSFAQNDERVGPLITAVDKKNDAIDIDINKAWICLESCDNQQLLRYLSETGINRADFLRDMDREELFLIAEMLPKFPKRTFMKAMGLLSS